MEKSKAKFSQAGNNVITVRVPASVAYNFEAITKVTQSVLSKVGCEGCHSGRRIDYLIEDNFFVDEKNNVVAIQGPMNEGY